MKDAFCIDLDRSLRILTFKAEDLMADLKFFGKKDPTELSDPDRKVFKTQKAAETYLYRYLTALDKLEKQYRVNSLQNGKSILLKRRYLVQVLLGEKLSTVRKYNKKWAPGTLFNFYDQSFFVPVKLKKITKLGTGLFRYDYSLLKKR